MKGKRIRRWSPAWWMVTAIEAGAACVLSMGAVVGALPLYSMRAGLPMPWEIVERRWHR